MNDDGHVILILLVDFTNYIYYTSTAAVLSRESDPPLANNDVSIQAPQRTLSLSCSVRVASGMDVLMSHNLDVPSCEAVAI